MTDIEVIQDEVLERAIAEMERFKQEVLQLAPQAILDRGNEIVVKTDFLELLQVYGECDDEVILALAQEPYPLDALHQHWQKHDESHMSLLRESAKDYADRHFWREQEKEKSAPKPAAHVNPTRKKDEPKR